tara:strand:+ start:1713 stop:2165 length:453 start_codon:yes stop_codon:yes gene_type:complete
MNNFLKTLLLIFLVSSCGYSPIYISDKIEFNYSKIVLEGNKQISNKIKNNIDYLENSSSNYSLIINSKEQKSVSSKNELGNPEVFNMYLEVNVKIFENDNLVKEKVFAESKSYNNTSSQFKLKQREENMSENLVKKVLENLRLFLKNIKE